MSEIYQQIGQYLVATFGSSSRKILLYSEADDGSIAADLFFQSNDGEVVYFRFAPKALQQLIYQFWEKGEGIIKARSWSVLQFLLVDGRFKVNLLYPDQIDSNEEIHDRRPKAIVQYFPGLKVDYSRPNG